VKDFAGRMITGAEASRPLRTLPAAFWISLFSFKEMLRRRRLIALGLVMLLPVAITLLWRSLDTESLISPDLWMANLGGVFYIHFLVALVSLAVGLSAISEPVEEGTIIYYWTRPIERSAIYLGRLFAAQMVGMVFLVCSLAVCFVVMTAGNAGALTFKFLKLYIGNVVIIGIGALVYTSIFACVGGWLKKPMFLSVLWAFGWESVGTSPAPQRIKELTVVFHLRNLIRNKAAGTESFPNLLEELKAALLREEPVPEWRSAVTLLAILVISTALGIWLLRRKEIFR
jgi:hypothetical protein